MPHALKRALHVFLSLAGFGLLFFSVTTYADAEDKTILLMANHGVLAVGETIAAAFDELYYFERAAETLMTCYATGKELRIVSDAVARMTEQQWRGYGQLAVDHLENIKAILDVEEPSYRR